MSAAAHAGTNRDLRQKQAGYSSKEGNPEADEANMALSNAGGPPGQGRLVPGTPRGQIMEPQRSREGTLTHVIETLLDKGLVINADIMVSVAGVELLGIRIRAALASFETAARYGLEFPAGTDRGTLAWKDATEEKETCPECGKRVPIDELLNESCPWCGWKSARAVAAQDSGAADATHRLGSSDGSRSGHDGSKDSRMQADEQAED
jgi:hypothetical protein